MYLNIFVWMKRLIEYTAASTVLCISEVSVLSRDVMYLHRKCFTYFYQQILKIGRASCRERVSQLV